MLRILKAVFGGSDESTPDGIPDALIAAATEKAIDGTDPRLRLVSGYKRKMRKSIVDAIVFVREASDAFAPPLELSRQSYANDPQVHALFGSADQLPEVLVASAEVRRFFAAVGNATVTEVYAGMRMRRSAKTVVAPKMRGDMVQMEELQTVVNFSEHEMVMPAVSEEALRRQLKERIFMALVESALLRIGSIKSQKLDLETQRTLLRSKLRHLRARGLGMEPFAGGDAPTESGIAGVERQLAETDRQLEQTTASIATLDEHLEQVNDVLGKPGDHIGLASASSRLTRMGFVTSADSPEPGNEIVYTEIDSATLQGIVGRLVRFTRDEPAMERVLKRLRPS